MSLRDALFKIYWRLQRTIAPGLKSSQFAYEEELSRRVGRDVRWLDLGCGHAVLPSWRQQAEQHLVERCGVLVGMDFDLPSLKAHRTIRRRVRGEIGRLPFESGSFDLVTMNMVVEHLNDPLAQFQEVHRVLAPGGVLIFHTPNALSYAVMAARLIPDGIKTKLVSLLEGRREEDIFRTHYRANTEGAIGQIAAVSGFHIADLRMVVTDAVFATVPPLALFELIWLRILMTQPLRSWRTNLVATLKKA